MTEEDIYLTIFLVLVCLFLLGYYIEDFYQKLALGILLIAAIVLTIIFPIPAIALFLLFSIIDKG